MIRRLAWATATGARGRDDDEPLALAALRRVGVETHVLAWDDPNVPWSWYDRVVLRSTWDYQDRMDEFLGWLDTVDQVTDLRNPLPMVRWSLDKRYLGELERAGIPTIPTTFVDPGTEFRLPSGPLVVKPSVGAGSRDVAVYQADASERELATEHILRLHEVGTTALIQPFLASVAAEGEWPLLFFAGEYSHAANKRVRLRRDDFGWDSGEDLFVTEDNLPHEADPAQVEVARAAVELITERFGTPTYARVDLVRDPTGGYQVLELELVEPSLFLPQTGTEAHKRLISALCASPNRRSGGSGWVGRTR